MDTLKSRLDTVQKIVKWKLDLKILCKICTDIKRWGLQNVKKGGE